MIVTVGCWMAPSEGNYLPRPPPGEQAGDDQRFPFGRVVLITEDNWLIADEWRAELEDAGYTVIGIAVSASEVAEMCARERPDFVLMDVRLLGERDGVDAAIAIRRDLGIGSVFITAHDDAAMHARAAAAEPLGWIVKPVVPSQLPSVLAGLTRPRN